MFISGIAACAADILVHITQLQVELPAITITDRKIGPVLIEELSVDGGRAADVDEDLILE